MNNPLVSAVVVTHNRKSLVAGAILSVQNQTYDNIELIVVDDASNDGSRELLSELADRDNFKYIYIQPDESKGGNHARNLGILASKGEYVAFLDDDDEWLPDKIYKQVEYMNVHPDCGVVACFNIVEFNFSNRFPENRDGMMEGDVHDKILTWIPFVTSVSMYRKSILIEAGMFDENLQFWQETELNIRVAQIAKFGCVHEELALYRVVDADKNRLTNNLEGWIDAVKYIEHKHKSLIEKLSKDDLRKHKLLVAKDGLHRAKKVKNYIWKKKFQMQIVLLEPNLRNIIKFIFPL